MFICLFIFLILNFNCCNAKEQGEMPKKLLLETISLSPSWSEFPSILHCLLDRGSGENEVKAEQMAEEKAAAATPPSKATFAGTYGLFLGFATTTSWADEQKFRNELELPDDTTDGSTWKNVKALRNTKKIRQVFLRS